MMSVSNTDGWNSAAHPTLCDLPDLRQFCCFTEHPRQNTTATNRDCALTLYDDEVGCWCCMTHRVVHLKRSCCCPAFCMALNNTKNVREHSLQGSRPRCKVHDLALTVAWQKKMFFMMRSTEAVIFPLNKFVQSCFEVPKTRADTQVYYDGNFWRQPLMWVNTHTLQYLPFLHVYISRDSGETQGRAYKHAWWLMEDTWHPLVSKYATNMVM